MEVEKFFSKLKKGKMNFVVWSLIALEVLVFLFMISSMSLYATQNVQAGIGSPNVTVRTTLNVGTVAPEILSVIIINNSAANSLTLVPNSTINVTVYVIARDFNNDTDIQNITLRFFDNVASSFASAEDNNNHYRNDSCFVDYSYGDAYEVNATCTVKVWYYANNQTWNATVIATDNTSLTDIGSNETTINALLALNMPDTIDYGTVNATQVSDERIANVTNAGNVRLNLSLSGYGYQIGDNLAMNCTLGSIKNISIDYEKYNLTASNAGSLTLQQLEAGNHTNLTASVANKIFNLNYRQDDSAPGVDDTNATYWRIYVPVGVAGSCSGNIVFGARVGTGT